MSNSKPIQTSYKDENGKKKLTITFDPAATMKEAKAFAGKTADTMGKLATAGIAKAKEFASRVPSVDLKVGKNETPAKDAAPSAKPAAKAEVKAGVKPAAKTQAKPAASAPKTKAKPVAKPETEAVAKEETK